MRIARRELAAFGRIVEEIAHGGAERGLGDLGQCLGHARNRPSAADIGQRDEQRRFRLHSAEAAHHAFLPWRRRGGTARLRELRGERLVRISGEQAERAPWVGAHQVPKIRRGFGDGPEQVACRRMIIEQGFELPAGGAFPADCREPFGEAGAARRRGERRRKIFASGVAGRA